MMDSSFLSESPLTSYLRIIDRLQARIDDISTKLQKYGYASVMSKLMDDNYDLKLKQKSLRLTVTELKSEQENLTTLLIEYKKLKSCDENMNLITQQIEKIQKNWFFKINNKLKQQVMDFKNKLIKLSKTRNNLINSCDKMRKAQIKRDNNKQLHLKQLKIMKKKENDDKVLMRKKELEGNYRTVNLSHINRRLSDKYSKQIIDWNMIWKHILKSPEIIIICVLKSNDDLMVSPIQICNESITVDEIKTYQCNKFENLVEKSNMTVFFNVEYKNYHGIFTPKHIMNDELNDETQLIFNQNDISKIHDQMEINNLIFIGIKIKGKLPSTYAINQMKQMKQEMDQMKIKIQKLETINHEKKHK